MNLFLSTGIQTSDVVVTQFHSDRSAHQASDERVHPLVADRAAEDPLQAGQRRVRHHPQRRDLKDVGKAVEGGAQRQRPGTVHHGGRAIEAAPHEGVSGLQVPTEVEKAERKNADVDKRDELSERRFVSVTKDDFCENSPC